MGSKIGLELRTGEARWWVHMDSCRLALLLYIWLRFSIKEKKRCKEKMEEEQRER